MRQGRAAGASCRGRREMGVRGRGEVQGCAGLKENGGGGVLFIVLLVRKLKGSPLVFYISAQKNIRYRGEFSLL